VERAVKAGLVVGVVAIIGLLAFSIWRANSGVPAPPAPPELASVDLSLPPSAPPSRALAAFFRPDPKHDDRAMERHTAAAGAEQTRRIKALLGDTVTLTVAPSYEVSRHVKGHFHVLHDGRWLRDPDEVLASLRGLSPPLAAFRAALHAKGCMPLPGYIRPEDLFSHPYFMAAVKLDLIESVALIQRGEHQRAARQIHRLAHRLLELEQRCTVGMMSLLILGSCLLQVQMGWAHLLAHPAAKAEHAGIWERMIRLESRPVQAANAWRREAVTGAGRIRSTNAGIWFDTEATIKVFNLLMKRRVWLAEAGLRSDAWTRPFVEDDYLDGLQTLQGYGWLRRNNDGLRTLSGMSRRGDYKYLVNLHQERCQAAARRALWMQELVNRGQPPPDKVLARAPVNRFTNMPFTTLVLRRPVCKTPARYRFSDTVSLAPLPGFPISADNSGPPPGAHK